MKTMRTRGWAVDNELMMIAPCVHQVAVCPPLVLQQAAYRANVADLSFSQFPLSSQFLIKVNRHHYCLFVLSGILNFHDISFKNIIVKKLPSKTSRQSSGKKAMRVDVPWLSSRPCFSLYDAVSSQCLEYWALYKIKVQNELFSMV